MVPERLKYLRKKYGYTLEYIGVEIGLDESTARVRISRYESGTHEPDYKTMQRISKVFGVPTAYFYASEDDLAESILHFYDNKNKP